MAGVNEDNEEFPGNYIGVNNDDDDSDGVLDFVDDENIYENDLVSITLSCVEPYNYLTGQVTFDESSDGAIVKVWSNKTKGTQVSLPATFNTPDDLGKTFYVEGISNSLSPRDVEFTLTYTKEGITFKDVINVTVVKVDLKATDLDGNVVLNQDEEEPGVYLHFNLDNDNDSDNSVPNTKLAGADYFETTNPVTNENDVKLLEMSMLPSLDFGYVILSTPSPAWLWESPQKGSSNFFLAGGSKTWDLSVEDERNQFLYLCSTLYVEGINLGAGDIVLKYKNMFGTEIHSDKVCYDFIAAYCGDQPKTEGEHQPGEGRSQRTAFEESFPLKRCEWSIIDNRVTESYNCIASSVDEYTIWYNPSDIDWIYGDKDYIFEDSDMDAFYHDKKEWGVITSGTDEEKANRSEAVYYSYDVPWNYRSDPNPPGPGIMPRGKNPVAVGRVNGLCIRVNAVVGR